MQPEKRTFGQTDFRFDKNFTPLLFSDGLAAHPFLKWAGGKTQLLPALMNEIPANFNKYIEPFVGGGALFFKLNHSNSIISDSNEELVITYNQIKIDVQSIISVLNGYRNTADFFYQLRSLKTDDLSKTEIAARMIFLNKTCFNGLFRVNKKGEFNVPYANNKNIKINTDNLFKVADALKNTTILHGDYKEIIGKFAEKGDFIFLDPPYQPVGKFSDFKRYTKEFFYESDQIELATVFRKLVDKGCHVLLTNSEHPLIFDLYKDFEIKILQTKRLINSNAASRSGTDIIVIGR